MIYGIQFGNSLYYGAGGYFANRTNAIKFSDRSEAEKIVQAYQEVMLGDWVFSGAKVITLDSKMSGNSRVVCIRSHWSSGNRHVWELEYDNGETRTATMLSPDDPDPIIVGQEFREHWFAVKNPA